MVRFLVVLLLCVVLVGCGNQGAAVSTESQSTKATEQGSTLERTKTIEVESRTAAMVSVPIAPLIGEAWGELVREEKDAPDQATCEGLWHAPLSALKASYDNEPKALLCAFKLGYCYAFTPTMGWPVEPKSEKGGSYRLRTLAHVLYVNNLASDIAAQVTARSYQNPVEAKAAIKQMLLEQRRYLLQLYSASFDLHLMPGTTDLAHAKDVMFSKGA